MDQSHGTPVARSEQEGLSAETFWERVDQTGECWVWRMGRTGGGYGQVRCAGRMTYAHRLAYLFANGPIPEGLFVLHRCDNPPCCRPDHLYAGTQADNVADRERRNRCNRPQRQPRKPPLRGSLLPQAKLTEAQVVEIRQRYRPVRGAVAALAREFGVASQTIRPILRGDTWMHVPMTVPAWVPMNKKASR